nr:FAD-dependent oxidoreductase [Paenibacillus sanguinis]
MKKLSRYMALLLVMVLFVQVPGISLAAKGGTAAKEAASAKTSSGGVLHYDVVVIGSELQGVLLTKSARDQGLDVLILDPRSKPGGELIQGQMIVLDEPNDNKGRSLVQGALKPLYANYKAGDVRKLASFKRFYQKLLQGIPLKSGITIESVKTQGVGSDKTMKSLTYKNRLGGQFTVEADYWVENTDFNALSSKLGEKRIPGMESIYAGQKPDYMAATYMMNFKNVNWGKLHQAVLEDYPLTNVRKKYGANTYVDWNFAAGFSNITYKYKPKDKLFMLRGLNATYQKDGDVVINALLVYDVDPSNPKSVENAVSKAKKEAPYILAFLQKNIPGFAKAKLGELPEYLYIRDYNRYETKYVLDYHDLMSSRMFWDNVTIGGYAVDLQATRVVTKGIEYGKPDRYGIPLRSFMLKSYDNVLVAGKNVGATIKAYGSARIMPTTALAGQTIGIILGRELKQGRRLDELTQADFKRIHQYLEKDYKIVVSK